jgi:hypothetical protein
MPPKSFIVRVLFAVGTVIPVSVAVALASGTPAEPATTGPAASAQAVDGAFSNSPRPGEAVFRAQDLGPGDTTAGTVLVTNEGASRGMFWLSRAGFSDLQGPQGGSLSDRLQLTVLDVSVPDSPLLVYTGGLTEMGARPLGFIAPEKSRIYSVAVTLLADTTVPASVESHPYEGSSTTLSLAWNAIAGQPPADAPAAGTDSRGPDLSIDLPGRQRLLTTAALLVNARCDEACHLSATGRLGAESAPHTAATTALSADKDTEAPMLVTFGPAARKTLREELTSGRSVPVSLSVIARDRTGNSTSITRKVWLRPDLLGPDAG